MTNELAIRIIATSNSNFGRAFRELLSHVHTAYIMIRDQPHKASEHVAQCEEQIESSCGKMLPTNEDPGFHDKVRDIYADLLEGRTESQNEAGFADVETNTEVLEVKPVTDWMHGFGQVMAYGKCTGKRKRLVLFGEKNVSSTIPDLCKRLCSEHGVSVELFQVKNSATAQTQQQT